MPLPPLKTKIHPVLRPILPKIKKNYCCFFCQQQQQQQNYHTITTAMPLPQQTVFMIVKKVSATKSYFTNIVLLKD